MNFVKALRKKVDATDISGIKTMLLKPISMVLSFFYTPLLLSYLGTEKYGLWATMLSIISWVNYCDVGIGDGLRNLLTKELTQKQYEDAQKSVSTAYVILSFVSVLLFVVLMICVGLVDFNVLFNTTLDITTPFVISFIFIIVNFILALSNTLLYALQLSERVALRNCLVQVLNIIGIILLKLFTNESLLWMAVLFGVTTLIVYVGNSIQIFHKYRYLSPKLKAFEKSKIASIGTVGIKFFVIQVSCLLLYTIDNVVITHYFGAAEVTPFHVADRAYSMVFSFLSALLVPYWSKTTEMLQKGDISWIRKALHKLHSVYGVFVIGYIILAVFFKPLARLWMGRELIYQPGLIGVMCAYYILYSLVTTHTPFINGTGKITGQLIVSTLMGILNVPLAIYLGVYCQLGVVGIRLGTTILMGVGAIFYPINLYTILKREEKAIQLRRSDN